jgi:hypothetical protein
MSVGSLRGLRGAAEYFLDDVAGVGQGGLVFEGGSSGTEYAAEPGSGLAYHREVFDAC